MESSSRDTVSSEQALGLERPAVAWTPAGAAALGRAYWREVERVTARLVRVHETAEGIALVVVCGAPTLLRLSRPVVHAAPGRVACEYAITGGLLARGEGGTLTVAQAGAVAPELLIRVAGFRPALVPAVGRRLWSGALYHGVQARIHAAVGRRFLRRVGRDGA